MITHLTPKHRLTGWIRDTHDPRDVKFQAAPAFTLKFKEDLREQFAEIPGENQGQAGSCVGNAYARMIEFHRVIKAGLPHIDYSRLFIYYGGRFHEGTIKIDAGMMGRTAMRVVSKTGVCREELWPYKMANLYKQPYKECFVDAANAKVEDYQRVEGLIAYKTAISNGFPTPFGIMVYSNFEKAAISKKAIIPLPKTRGIWRDRLVGGHEILGVGYDDDMLFKLPNGKLDQGCAICANSWGVETGDAGHIYIPYPLMESPAMTEDYWTATKITFKE